MENISPYKHVLSSEQFNQDFINETCDLAKYMKANLNQVQNFLKGKIVLSLFYEASTRTRLSFESAALRLGASILHTENANLFSSVSKGETLEDTIRVSASYADFIILRHHDDSSSEIAASVSNKPILNAGAGKNQHPTQAMLDVYTINENFNRLNNLCLTVVGDLKRGRTANSLVRLMAKFVGNTFKFVSPENSKITNDLRNFLLEKNISFEETTDFKGATEQSDIVYVTRIQRERFESEVEYQTASGKYILTEDMLNSMPEKSIIMHPLPRVDEIPQIIDENYRAKYFEQAENGLYVRMALLKILNDHLK